MEFKRGEIVLLPFPFDDLSGAKKRPVLIVSSNDFNKISRTIIVVEITSNLRSGFQELNIEISDDDVDRYPNTKPLKPSIVKPYVIFSVNKKLVIKKIGILKDEKLKEVFLMLRKTANIFSIILHPLLMPTIGLLNFQMSSQSVVYLSSSSNHHPIQNQYF